MTTTSRFAAGPCPGCSAAGDYCRCSCDECDPDTSGPSEDCPEHGDVRVYAKWLNQACVAYDEREVEFKRLLADQAATTARLWVGHHATKVCDADRARLIERVRALTDDPWVARNQGKLARYQEGVSRRGAVRYGEFVSVADIRAALEGTS